MGASNVQAFRFIPACAGNIMEPLDTAVLKPVHPRVCGEHMAAAKTASVTFGSSPRVRGTSLYDAA